MSGHNFFHGAVLVQNAYLRSIAVGHMGNRIFHVGAHGICLCKILAKVLLSFQLLETAGLQILFQLFTGTAGRLPCHQCLS